MLWADPIVRISFPLLTSSDTLDAAYRWRLIDGFFLSIRPPIEGCIAIAIVAVIGWVRSGGAIFPCMMALNVAVVIARLLYTRHYRRCMQGGRRRGDTPERLARSFLIFSVAAASLWGGLNLGAVLSGDPMLQMFLLMVQSGWLGLACTRNAASPATVVWQGLVVLVPAAICVMSSHTLFLYFTVPLGFVQLAATLGVAHTIGGQIAATLLSEQRLEVANARLTQLSATDGLTGMANRRAFDAALEAEWGRARRDGTDLGLLLIDVDHFKIYNDTCGHPAGDDCLRAVAEATAMTLRRPPDFAARFGGEEFVAILPGTDAEGAMEVAERVRAAVFALDLVHGGSAFGRVTVSLGAASLAPHPGMASQSLIDLADRALYEAKHAGRNRSGRGGPVVMGPWLLRGAKGRLGGEAAPQTPAS